MELIETWYEHMFAILESETFAYFLIIVCMILPSIWFIKNSEDRKRREEEAERERIRMEYEIRMAEIKAAKEYKDTTISTTKAVFNNIKKGIAKRL